MARPKKKRSAKKERRLHQEPVVRRVADILATGEPTKFRWASTCRHAVRAALCMQGKSWAAADKHAQAVVSLALVRIGATVPTWRVAMGSPPEHHEYFYCGGCRGYMEGGNSSPWCSEECRNMVYMRTRYYTEGLDDSRKRTAMRVIMTGGKEQTANWQKVERRCHRCSKLYTPTNNDQRYCSRICWRNHERGPERPCLVCASPFRPKAESQIYCSPACKDESDRRRYHAEQALKDHSTVCVTCGGTFTTRDPRKLYCRPLCRSRASDKARKIKLAEQRQARPCAFCGEDFTPPIVPGATPIYCSYVCAEDGGRRRAAERLARKASAPMAKAA